MSKTKIEDQVLVIFGASGDLTMRKLIPAVFNLYKRGFLPQNYQVLGVSRTHYTDQEYQKLAVLENPHLPTLEKDELAVFAQHVRYQAIDTADITGYHTLKERLDNLFKECSISKNCIFYLSTPPSLYETIGANLSKVGLNKESDGWKRVIIEKPFGYDLASANALNERLLNCFQENQLYRIDHYLGKETVQNLLVTRFANSIFEPLWNRNYIQRVEITSAESVGVEKRGGYYDKSGAMRDMIQNHLLQLVALVAMEPPAKMDATSIRNEKDKVFQAIRPLTQEEIRKDVIRGQYMASTYKEEAMTGYREETGVAPESRTETFAAIKFFIDNWRWADVPFYIRTGKKLPTRVSEVVIHFKPNHHHLFSDKKLPNQQNILVFRIQPNEGILLKFGLKVPGTGVNVESVNMDFLYEDLSNTYVPEAYERLLLDCMQGDATLYARGDSVLKAWEFVDPILKAWKDDPSIPVYGYPAGTWGPENAMNMIEGEGLKWRNPCKNLTNDGIYCEL
ncbi:glucose-6-phosphate 1-dehydrogenase [Marivirga lumbricoides]|uniref:Glucose-6-phosphate 1-dehydrogenase n=1 Tax=Marivirga lumbricoides TaxID=1046115 RepID=A0ABQ1M5I4_9BACT|nr:glucose-6-phosphate 1-dehydrogenase [Marivirga lumbricoides]